MKLQTKNRALILGFMLILLIAYHFAISKTFETRSELKTIETQTLGYGDLSVMNGKLKLKEVQMDSILSKNNLNNTSIQNNLLEVLNTKASDETFKISEFNEPHQVTQDAVTITSYQFTLQGNFEGMQEVVYSLEQEYSFGKITHVSFEKKRDFRKRKDYLKCSVILENLVSE
tara:strand:+ start:419146 stop:419664 length:519 start_codon:yes stop_codon:yes gene_type:complete